MWLSEKYSTHYSSLRLEETSSCLMSRLDMLACLNVERCQWVQKYSAVDHCKVHLKINSSTRS